MSSIAFAHHASIQDFDVVNGEIHVGGMPVTRLAARLGQTPFYVYSRRAIADRVATLRALLPAKVHVHYAVKANPMPAVVQLLASLTDGLDVASAQELGVALDTGMSASKVSFAGPGKTVAEIEQAIAAGVTLNLESEQQLTLALSAGERLGVEPQLAIRVNPAFELKSSGMRMGGGPKPFGVDEECVPRLASTIEAAGLGLRGFHIYCGSQNLNALAIVDAQTRSCELGSRLAAGLRRGIDWLNIGGGFGVPYFPGEMPLDVRVVAENLEKLSLAAGRDLGVPLVLELGRYLVAEAGLYVCRVIDRKVSQGQTFLVTDGGLHHHLAATGNFGQVIRKNYPVAVGNRVDSTEREVQTVVGPLCTPLDLLADRMEMAHAVVGDLIVVFQSGAYGKTASPSAFLSHPAVVEALV